MIASLPHSARPNFRAILGTASLLALALSALPVIAQVPEQSSELVAQKTDGGVLFQFDAPGASAVYLAGDFNEWAKNTGGTITDEEFRMEGPDEKGIWRKVVKLEPGQHSFKFSVDGIADKWIAPTWAKEFDDSGNAIIYVTPDGYVHLQSDQNPEWAPKQSEGFVTFRIYRPKAQVVYLAGDFNNWADNQESVVSEPKHALTGPDENGVWQKDVPISPGRRTYKFVIDGNTWIADPNVEAQDEEGRSVLEVQ